MYYIIQQCIVVFNMYQHCSHHESYAFLKVPQDKQRYLYNFARMYKDLKQGNRNMSVESRPVGRYLQRF